MSLNTLILNMALNLSTRLRLNTEEIRVLVENLKANPLKNISSKSSHLVVFLG
jgi:hypothetical protein